MSNIYPTLVPNFLSENTLTEKPITPQILLVEDNLGDARLVEIYLENSDLAHYQVINKQSLQEALNALETGDFMAILLDLSLPDSRGLETLQRLTARFPDANVIVMTGLDDKALGLNAVKAGAQDFLVKKDFDSDLLAKTLRYSIERKTVLARLAESQKAREVAEESARLKEQFIAGISHEMRTPMNAIYGMSNLLVHTHLTEEQADYVQSIRQSSEILLGVINDILEISTLQNGIPTFDSQVFNLKDLLENLVKVMQYKKNEKTLAIDYLLLEDVPTNIVGDKLRLNQILFNIVGNAIKFTDEGFVKIVIRKVSNERLQFMIQDSGIGIPNDKVHTIFETFTRIKTKDRLFEGTGLGLSIVKNLVEQQGGRVWAESELGVGTSIFFELPYILSESKNTPIVDIQKESIPITPPNHHSERPFSLFLVEDHKMNQIVARKTLERQFPNIRITIAEDGKKAIDILKSGNIFDIILMDIQMPVMDGNEATAYIRQHLPELANTPILAMTAHAYISKDDAFRQYGFNDYVLKPFEPNELFEKINQYIN